MVKILVELTFAASLLKNMCVNYGSHINILWVTINVMLQGEHVRKGSVASMLDIETEQEISFLSNPAKVRKHYGMTLSGLPSDYGNDLFPAPSTPAQERYQQVRPKGNIVRVVKPLCQHAFQPLYVSL